MVMGRLVVERVAPNRQLGKMGPGFRQDDIGTYSAVCSRNSATSFAVSFEPFVPNRAVT